MKSFVRKMDSVPIRASNNAIIIYFLNKKYIVSKMSSLYIDNYGSVALIIPDN
jgi:hypothetical protein